MLKSPLSILSAGLDISQVCPQRLKSAGVVTNSLKCVENATRTLAFLGILTGKKQMI
jgi:hypothetical protein